MIDEAIEEMSSQDDVLAVAFLLDNKTSGQRGGMMGAIKRGNAKHKFTEQQLQLARFVLDVQTARQIHGTKTD